MLYLIVFIGAGIGGALRHGVNVAATRQFGFGFPFGTLIVNIVGSFAMGLLAGYFAFRPGINQHMRLFLTTGDPGWLHYLLGLFSRHCIARRTAFVRACCRLCRGIGRGGSFRIVLRPRPV